MAAAFRQLLWMLWLDVLPCSAKFHNKKMDDIQCIQSTSPTKMLRQHVHSLHLNNKLSGQETEKLQAEIAECKVPGFKIQKNS